MILVGSLVFTSILSITMGIALRNLLVKVEKYEDVVEDQVKYLQNISNLIAESQAHIKSLDDRGIFESDDEVGAFFSRIKEVQKELDRYMLPENYGKKEE